MSMPTTATRYRWSELPKDEPMALLQRRRVIGERSMISQVHLQQGCVVPTHAHFNEQFACIVSGRLRFTIGPANDRSPVELTVAAGEVLHLPSNVPHAAEALEDTIVLDVFSPPSEKTGIDLDK